MTSTPLAYAGEDIPAGSALAIDYRSGRAVVVKHPTKIAVTGEASDLLASYAEHRHPSIRQVTRFFEYAHLPEHLQDVSAPFAAAAYQILSAVTEDDPELTVALRKLLEAKDAAVRAAVATG